MWWHENFAQIKDSSSSSNNNNEDDDNDTGPDRRAHESLGSVMATGRSSVVPSSMSGYSEIQWPRPSRDSIEATVGYADAGKSFLSVHMLRRDAGRIAQNI